MNRYSIETYETYELQACGCCTEYLDRWNVKILSDTGNWLDVPGGSALESAREAHELIIRDLGGEVEYDN